MLSRAESGVRHLMNGVREISPAVAQQVHDLSGGKFDRAALVFGVVDSHDRKGARGKRAA